MTDIKMFESIGINLRTGLNSDGVAFVVAADLAQALNVKNTTQMLNSVPANESEYKGMETVQTAGGLQKVNVLYKRGVFHVLMLSRKVEAVAFKDELFDFLEKYEREGFVVSPDITPQQSIRMIEKLDYKMVLDALAFSQDYKDSGLSPRSFANMQNGFYKVTIGTTAADFRRTRELPEKATVKDFLSDDELARMQGLSMMIIGKLRARHPDGVYTVREFAEIYHNVIQEEMDRKGISA